jgi:hypothetical protein
MPSMTRPHGVGDCPKCDGRVLFAYGPDGKRAALVPAPGKGPFAVAWSADWVPTFREVAGNGQLALGEHLFAPHPEDCDKPAVVVPISAARMLRVRAVITERRAASAR